jgi:hypothetical protein
MNVKRREAILASASTLPFALALAGKGWRKALKDAPHLRAELPYAGRDGARRVTGAGAWSRPIQPGARTGENKRKQKKVKLLSFIFFY